VADFQNRLQLFPDPDISGDELLKEIPVDAAPLARALWERRPELEKWIEAEPGRAELLITSPEKVLREVFPDLRLPHTTIPGSELKKQVLGHVLPRGGPFTGKEIERYDPVAAAAQAAAMELFLRLYNRIVTGVITSAQVAADPEAAVQGAAAVGIPAAAVSQVVAAIRFVLGLPPP
jgi:hypothetical protein